MLSERKDDTNDSSPPSPDDYPLYSRLFNDESTLHDFKIFLETIEHVQQLEEVTIIDGLDLPEVPDMTIQSLPDFKAYGRSHIYLHVPPNKWAVFVVIPSVTKQRDRKSVV